MSTHCLRSRVSAHITITWEDKCHDHECTPFHLLSLRFYCWVQYHMVWNIPLVSCPSHVPSLSLAHPQLTCWRREQRKPCHCASTVQQEPKHWCITNAVLATYAKQSTTPAAVKKVNSIPARHSTTLHNKAIPNVQSQSRLECKRCSKKSAAILSNCIRPLSSRFDSHIWHHSHFRYANHLRASTLCGKGQQTAACTKKFPGASQFTSHSDIGLNCLGWDTPAGLTWLRLSCPSLISVWKKIFYHVNKAHPCRKPISHSYRAVKALFGASCPTNNYLLTESGI